MASNLEHLQNLTSELIPNNLAFGEELYIAKVFKLASGQKIVRRIQYAPESILVVLAGELDIYIEEEKQQTLKKDDIYKLKPEIEYIVCTEAGCKFFIVAIPVIQVMEKS
jgi:hypothetical protein